MASVPLIEQYLTELHRYLGRIRRADEICAEARDHLLAAVERHHAAGMDLEQAQRRALADYGDPRTIARSFLTTRGKVMLPTRTTRLAGLAGIAGGSLWMGLASSALFEPSWWQEGPWFWLARVLACALTFWAVAGLIVRHGGANGALGRRSVLSLALIAVCQVTGFTVWSVPSGIFLLGIATLLVGTTLWSAGIAPRWAILQVAGGPLVAMVSFWAVVLATGLATNGIVPVTQDTDAFLVAGGVPTGAGMMLLGLGLADLGNWMRREVPIEGLDAVSA